MNYVTHSYRESLEYDQSVFRKLLDFLPKRDREKFNYGISLDTLAEVVTAYARNTLAANEEGFDLQDGVEVKYAKYTRYKSGKKDSNYYKWSADIGNLNSKRGMKADLCVIISRDTPLFGIEFIFMNIPWKVWEKEIPSNKFSFCFNSNAVKWYSKFVISEKEYGL